MNEASKQCNLCVTEKALADFPPDNRAKDGKQGRCRKCCNKWHNDNPMFRREACLKFKYGISQSDYLEMLRIQDGKCAICKSPYPGKPRMKYFAVDHDHDTGRVRGLLCDLCNKGIGQFKENVAAMEFAIGYLRAHGR